MKSWMTSLRETLYRPNVGAAGELSNLRVINIGHPWIDRLSVSSSWVLIVFVWVVLLVPFPAKAEWNVLGIIAIIVAYSVWVVILEVLSRAVPPIYDLPVSRILRIAVNLALVTGLVRFSSGADSYFWYLYTLPLFQANLYFRRLGVLIILAVTILLFWLASWDFSSVFGISSRTFGDLLTHSLTLGLWAGMLYWFFGAARNNRKQEAEVVESLCTTSMAIVQHLDQPTVLNTIIDRAKFIVNASGAGIYEYDPEKEELTVIADQGGTVPIGHKLKKGEAMAGQVVAKGTWKKVDDYSTWPDRASTLDSKFIHAVVEVPLTLPGQGIVGVLYATNRRRGDTFGPLDVELLSVLAGHAAIALNHANTFAESNRNLAQLKLLEQVSSKLTYALDLRANLLTILHAALKTIGVDDGSIMIFDSKTETLEIMAWIVEGEARDCRNHKKLGLGEGIAGHVAQLREPINCRDTLTDSRYLHSMTDRPLRSILSIPTIANEKLLCIINADSTQPNRFDDGDIKLLSVLGAHVATMIESLRLREEVLSLTNLTLNELYVSIVEGAFTLVGGDAASLFLKINDTVTRVAVYPPQHSHYEDRPREDGLTTLVLETGKPRIIDDAQNDPDVKPEVKKRDVASLVAVPLNDSRVGSDSPAIETIGVLFVSTKIKRQFGANDVQILESLASHAASAIIQARLVDEVAAERDFQTRLMANSFDAVIAIDTEGLVTEFNPSAEKLLGYTRSEVLGTDVGLLYCEREDAKRVHKLLYDDKHKGRLINHFTCAKSKDGKSIPIRLSASRLENGSVGFFRDQTELEDMRQRVQQLHGALTTTPNAELDELKSTVNASADRALDLLGANVVWIYYYDDEQDEFQLPPTVFPAGHNNAPGHEILPLITSLFETDSDLFVEDISNHDAANAALARIPDIRSMVASPLKGKDRTLGVLVCGYKHTQSFSDDRQFLIRKYISDSAVNALERSHLPALLDGFYKMSLESTTADIALESRLQTVLDFAVKATGAESGALGVIGPNQTIKRFLHSGVRSDVIDKLKRPTGKGVLKRLLSGDFRINESDISKHPLFKSFESSDHPEIKSFLGTSIVVHGKSVGNLYVGNKKGGETFSQQDETFLRILANWGSLSYKLSRDLEQGNTQEAINISVFLLSQLAATAAEKGAAWSTALRQLANQQTPSHESASLRQLADDMRDLASPIQEVLEGLQKSFSDVALNNTVAQVVNQKRKEHPDIKFDTELEPACLIRGNDLALRLVLNVVIENAIKATRKANRTSRPIGVSCKITGELVFCTVRDSGSGIPTEVRSRVFNERFSHNGVSHESSFIVGRVLRWHEGEVRAAETDANGTTIEFIIPRANK